MEKTLSTDIFIPDEWSSAASAIADSAVPCPVILICGEKNSGKTMFSRFLLNVLLSKHKRIAYLDTDVGQSEFTPPGCLSITVINEFIPDLSILCLKTPQRCYFFGDISSGKDPSSYKRYVHALLDYYYCGSPASFDGPRPPLIVNTPGWIKGAGYHILVDMINHTIPTHVVKMETGAKTLPDGAFWSGDAQNQTLIEIKWAHPDSAASVPRKDARLLRDLRIMAYFRQCLPRTQKVATVKDLARALSSLRPYEVSTDDVTIKHLHAHIPSSEMFYCLNVSIVGLAFHDDESTGLAQCVGLGIVRGVDASRGVVHVITPVPQIVLEKVDHLLQGFVEIPSCLLEVAGCISPYSSQDVLPS